MTFRSSSGLLLSEYPTQQEEAKKISRLQKYRLDSKADINQNLDIQRHLKSKSDIDNTIKYLTRTMNDAIDRTIQREANYTQLHRSPKQT